MLAAPAASRAKVIEHTSIVTTGPDGFNRRFLRNGFNGFLRALPGDRACLPPSPADIAANLTPASGRQDHTTSSSASASFVGALFARLTPPRPLHPAPNVRDDREAPLLWERDGESCRTDLGSEKPKYFFKGD